MGAFDGLNKTTNLNLNKPAYDNVADIEALNENADILDSTIKSIQEGKSDVGHTHNYLPLTGGTLTGILRMDIPNNLGSMSIFKNSDSTKDYGSTVIDTHADGSLDSLTVGNYYDNANGVNYRLTLTHKTPQGVETVSAIYGEHNLTEATQSAKGLMSSTDKTRLDNCYIVASGSNYIRYANGLQMCWVVDACKNGTKWTYPVPFKSNPVLTATHNGRGNMIVSTTSSTTTSCAILIKWASSGDTTPTASTDAHILAIGWWK